jgi:hypothetical protein
MTLPPTSEATAERLADDMVWAAGDRLRLPAHENAGEQAARDEQVARAVWRNIERCL